MIACSGKHHCPGRINALENLIEANYALDGFNFTRANLSGINLVNKNLSNVNFSHATLTAANLVQSQMESTQLKAAHLKGTNLASAQLQNSNLRGADLIVANLETAKLNGADLTGAELYRTQLIDAKLQDCLLTGSDLYRANFTRANLKNVDFRAADLTGAILKDADLTGADFRTLKLRSSFDFNRNLQNLPLTGVGFTIARGDNNNYYVNVIYPNSPAQRAGIKRGDQISHINGNSIANDDLDIIYHFLFAPAGTPIQFTIRRSTIVINHNLTSENLTLSVIGITPKQIKEAKNWDKAYYDPQFRQQLGLPLTPP